MRTRDKSMADYGVSKEREKELYELCRGMCEVEENFSLLCHVAYSVNSELASAIIYSLTHGLSYDAISKETYIPIGRDDFYAYRRKTLAELNKELGEKDGKTHKDSEG